MPQIELAIKNFPAQQRVFKSKARYKIVVKGRRFGITKGGANDFIEAAIKKEFKKGIWVDTINGNINKYVERYFLPELKKLPKDKYNWQKQEKILTIFDSYIDFRSADRPENIEGFGYDKAFLNEAGIILKNRYLWDNAIRPMLLEYKCPAVIGGTPKGKGLFHELAARGKDSNQPLYEFFHFSTYDNPYLDPYEIDALVKDMPDHVAKQEIYAEFIDDSGTVFRNTKAVMTASPEQPRPNSMYVMGVDLAKVQDYTVIVVYDRATNRQVYYDRFNKLDWNFQKEKIISISRHYNRAPAVVDATGVGDPIAEDLIRAGVSVIPIHITNEIKKQMIEKLILWIDRRLIRMLSIPEALEEFNDFTYDISTSGKIKYNAPEGMHDDIVIAHALAVQELFEKYVPVPQPELSRVKRDYLETMRARGYHGDIESQYEPI